MFILMNLYFILDFFSNFKLFNFELQINQLINVMKLDQNSNRRIKIRNN